MLIDVTRLANRMLQGRLPTGVDRVGLAYLQHFHSKAHALVRIAGRWVELDGDNSRRVFDALLSAERQRALTIRRCVGQGYAFSWRRNRGAILFNTGHSGLDRAEYIQQIRRHALRPIFFLHDLIPISHPEYCRPGEADKHHLRLNAMLSAGQGLIVNSEATRQDLLAYAEQQARRMPPCIVAPLAAARLPWPARERPLDKPYFVVLGTIEPRKNHLLLLHLWRQLVQELGNNAPRLVVIGQRGWECEQVVDLLDRCEALRGYVVEKPRCDDHELATWLYHAQALLFPSFAEGFGIPLVEALMLGVPAIASDLSVFHEIAGKIPEYRDPLDGPGWKSLIQEYMQPGSVRRRSQCERVRGYIAPTWDEHFAKVDEFMKALDGSALASNKRERIAEPA